MLPVLPVVQVLPVEVEEAVLQEAKAEEVEALQAAKVEVEAALLVAKAEEVVLPALQGAAALQARPGVN